MSAPVTAEITLRVYCEDREIFSSTGKWLYPMFELEAFLTASSFAPDSLHLEDKIIGKAAALLLVRLGVRRVTAGVLSELGRAVLERFDVHYHAAEVVDRIDCQTETLLADVEDAEQAYRIVKARAGR